MHDAFTIFIVDDDLAVRDALGLMLGVRGYRIAMFGDAESFLQAYQRDWRGCLLLDIRMPGMDGLMLQRELVADGCRMPVIIMTGHGDVASARDAFRAHALDFLEKPLDHQQLLAAIEDAFTTESAGAELHATDNETRNTLTRLTRREREVMDRVVSGQHNRRIAEELGISPRTVEVHKARVMDKLGVNSVAELVRVQLLGSAGRTY